jgi:Fe-S cluster assembly iron-binding protein IscA
VCVPQASQPDDNDQAGLGQIQAPTPQPVGITWAAVARIKDLLAREGRTGLRLRAAAQPTACCRPRYQLFFDDRRSATDTVVWFDEDGPATAGVAPGADSSGDEGFEVVIARSSLRYLAGATIDYAESLQRPGFIIGNPGGKGSCGCGSLSQGPLMAETNQPGLPMAGLDESGIGGNELDIPMAWLCAEQTAEHLITCVDKAMLPDTFEFRAACNVLALTMLLAGLSYRAASLSARQIACIRDLISGGGLWLGWSDSQLSSPGAVAAADLRLARNAWRWLVQGRLLSAPEQAEPDNAYRAWTRPGAGCRIGLMQAQRITDACVATE